MNGFSRPNLNTPAPSATATAPVTRIKIVKYPKVGRPQSRSRSPMSATSLPVIIPLILIITSAILLGASLATPWYSYGFSMKGGGIEMTGTMDFSVDGMHTEVSMSMLGLTQSVSDDSDYEESGLEETQKVFDTVSFLVVAGIVMSVVALVMMGMAVFRRFIFDIAIFMVLLSFIMVLIAPVYFASSINDALEEDLEKDEETGDVGLDGFSGSDSASAMGLTMNVSWGPSTGWYLAVIACILQAVALVVMVVGRFVM